MSAWLAFVTGTSLLTVKVTSAWLRSWISTFLTDPTVRPATRTSSPFVSRLALLNRALYSVVEPNPKFPMIIASTEVTTSETAVKMPSLTAATVVTVFRALISVPPRFVERGAVAQRQEAGRDLRVRQAQAPRSVAPLAVLGTVLGRVRPPLDGVEGHRLADATALEDLGEVAGVAVEALEQAGVLRRVGVEQRR